MIHNEPLNNHQNDVIDSLKQATNRVSNSSQVESSSFYSPTLKIDWNYSIYLPKNYQYENSDRYAVLYMLHGIHGNHRNLLERFDSQSMLDQLLQNKPLLVVFVDGFNNFYLNQPNSLQIETAIIQDLIPYIESTYSASKFGKNRFIGGISMGGYGASRLFLKYPDLFQKAALISPAVWDELQIENPIRKRFQAFGHGKQAWDSTPYRLAFPTKTISPAMTQDHEIWLTSSSDDQVVPITDVQHFVKEIQSHQIKITFEEVSGDDHNWRFWEKATYQAYQWIIAQL